MLQVNLSCFQKLKGTSFSLFACQEEVGVGENGWHAAARMKYRDLPDWIFLMNSVMLWNHLKTVIYFVTGARYIAVLTNKPEREMTFSLSRCVVMKQNQQVWQHMLPAFCLIMEHADYTPTHDGPWCQTARDMTWIKCKMRVFKHSYGSSLDVNKYVNKVWYILMPTADTGWRM